MSTAAKVITHSVANGIELITLQLRAPKFLDAEFEKHRMISSNSSSDRAIPFSKMIERPYFLPTDVRLNEPGMQGYQVMSDDEVAKFHLALIDIYGHTTEVLKQWNHVHKQHLNRYLLGFSWQDKVATANKDYFYKHFFPLRLENGADPAMQELARVMKAAIDSSMPSELAPGDWHLPYVTETLGADGSGLHLNKAIKCSVARCARVSYLNHDKSNPDIQKDIKLHDELLAAGHMSPLENVCTPMPPNVGYVWRDTKGVTHIDKAGNVWSGNFRGFIQYRQLL